MTTAGQKAGAPAPATSEIGTVLAQRYEVVRELGRGGMGVVYLCRDIVTGERVALKRLRSPEKGETRARRRAGGSTRRRAPSRSLDHPAIVRARDFGTLADGIAVPRHGRAARAQRARVDAHDARSPGRSSGRWSIRCSRGSRTRTRAASSTATSSRRTSCSTSRRPARGPRAYILDLGLAWLREYRHDSRLDGAPRARARACTRARAPSGGWRRSRSAGRRRSSARRRISTRSAASCTACSAGKEVFEGNAQDVLRAHKRTPVPPPQLPEGVPAEAGAFVLRLLAKKPWHRFEFAADARRAWMQHPAARTRRRSRRSCARARRRSRAAPRAPRVARASLAAGHPQRCARRRSSRATTSGASCWQRVDDVGARQARRARSSSRSSARPASARAASPSGSASEVHEQRHDVPLRARYGRIADAARRHHRRGQRALRPRGRRPRARRADAHNRWEVAQGRRRGAHLGRRDRRVAPARRRRARSSPLGPTRQALRARHGPSSAGSSSGACSSASASDRPVLLWFDDLHLASPNTFEVLSRLHRDAPKLPPAHRRHRAQRDARDRPRRRAAHGGAARGVERARSSSSSRSATDETEALLRATLPLDDDAVARASSRAAATRSSRCSSSTRGRAAAT